MARWRASNWPHDRRPTSDIGINTADQKQLTAALRWHRMSPDGTPRELVEAIRAIPHRPQKTTPNGAAIEHTNRADTFTVEAVLTAPSTPWAEPFSVAFSGKAATACRSHLRS